MCSPTGANSWLVNHLVEVVDATGVARGDAVQFDARTAEQEIGAMRDRLARASLGEAWQEASPQCDELRDAPAMEVSTSSVELRSLEGDELMGVARGLSALHVGAGEVASIVAPTAEGASPQLSPAEVVAEEAARAGAMQDWSVPCEGDILFYDRDQPWSALSSFHRSEVTVDGAIYPTAEHAYHAQKFEEEELRARIRATSSAREALNLANSAELRSAIRADWHHGGKLAAMAKVVAAKFARDAPGGPALFELLLSTGDARLIEDTPTDSLADLCWGCGPDRLGANQLGRALMVERTLGRGRLVGVTDDVVRPVSGMRAGHAERAAERLAAAREAAVEALLSPPRAAQGVLRGTPPLVPRSVGAPGCGSVPN